MCANGGAFLDIENHNEYAIVALSNLLVKGLRHNRVINFRANMPTFFQEIHMEDQVWLPQLRRG